MMECHLGSENDYNDVMYHFARSVATLEEGYQRRLTFVANIYLFLMITPPRLARWFVRRHGPMSNNANSVILESEVISAVTITFEESNIHASPSCKSLDGHT